MKCSPSPQDLGDAGQVFFGLPLQVFFFGFEVNKTQHGQIVHDRRNQRHFDDCQIAGVGEFRHQKGTSPHDWRHELPAGGGGRLNRTGHMGSVADALHHGDGEGTGGHHIADGGTGNRAHETRSHHGRFWPDRLKNGRSGRKPDR